MSTEITVAPDEHPARTLGRTLQIDPVHMGYKPDLNYDSIESLIEHGEGAEHR